MRVLLDECAPRKIRSELPSHDVQTVKDDIKGPIIKEGLVWPCRNWSSASPGSKTLKR